MHEIPKLYSTFAKYYDRLESQYRNYDEDSSWILETISSLNVKRIIDVSCGTGNHISRLAAKSDLSFYAMDSSEEMIDIAAHKPNSERINFIRADYLNMPYLKGRFDCAICMYWSLAGLNEKLVLSLFGQLGLVLSENGVLIFDVENSEGIKENLIGAPFIDSFFEEKESDSAVIRCNLSNKIEPDLVDWRAYYLIDKGGVSELFEDKMKLRFYSRGQLERLLSDSGFDTIKVISGPFRNYEKNSPSLYFVARKKKEIQ